MLARPLNAGSGKAALWHGGAGIISSLTLRDGYRSGERERETADGGDDNDNRIMPSCGAAAALGEKVHSVSARRAVSVRRVVGCVVAKAPFLGFLTRI